MSKKRLATVFNNFFNATFLLIILLASSPIAAFATSDAPCTDNELIELNSSLRGYGSLTGESSFFQAEITEAGLLTLDVAVSGSAKTEAKLGLFDLNCDQENLTEAEFTIVERSPTGWVAWVEMPGTLTFAVAAQDPMESLGEYKLTAGFAATRDVYSSINSTPFNKNFAGDGLQGGGDSPGEIEIEPDVNDDPLPLAGDGLQGGGDSPGEIEIEPDVNNDPLPLAGDGLQGGGDSPGEIEIEPDVKDDPLPLAGDGLQGGGDSPGEIEIEPDVNDDPLPLAGDGLQGGGDSPGEIEIEPDVNAPFPLPMDLRKAMRQLCRTLDQDDHGDTPICATRIDSGREVRGTIYNSWGDDHDLFGFHVSETLTVYIEAAGPTDTYATLLDRQGQSLATDDDGGEYENFRIVKTLSPGRYFVRVEGSLGAEGPYSLRFETQPW